MICDLSFDKKRNAVRMESLRLAPLAGEHRLKLLELMMSHGPAVGSRESPRLLRSRYL